MVINNLMFSLIDSFLAQLEHCSWAFKAGNPSPLVCVSLSRTLCFFLCLLLPSACHEGYARVS